MKNYIITQQGTNTPTSVKATTPALAMVKYMDKYYSSFYGPVYVDGWWEIYSDLGNKLKFKVS